MTAPVTTTPPPSAPTSGNRSLSGAVGAAQTKEMFLQILVAQMRNQDPMNPSSPEQMASQLAQFSSLEQLIGINERLGEQGSANQSLLEALQARDGALMGAVQAGAAVASIGREVIAPGDGLTVSAGRAPQVRIALESPAATARLTLLDERGRTVGTHDLGALAGGDQRLDLGAVTAELPPGTYRYKIDATDAQGRSVPTRQWSLLRVDAVTRDASGPLFLAGPFRIPFADVSEVR